MAGLSRYDLKHMNDGRGKTYTVKGGDSAASIAKDIYGNERMMAEILRLNGGVKTLRPGMVLRLPKPKDNRGIFISNEWAANMGMATTDQLKDYYAANPGGNATRDFNAAGYGWKNSIAGGGAGVAGLSAPGGTTSGTTSNTTAPVPMTPDQIAATRAAAGRSIGVNRPAPAVPNQGPTIPPASTPNLSGTDKRMADLRNSGRSSGVPVDAFGYRYDAKYPAQTPLAPTSNNLGASATVNRATTRPPAYGGRYNPTSANTTLTDVKNAIMGNTTPPTTTQTGSKNTATQFTPQQAWALPDNYALTPMPANQDPLTVSMIAPYVSQAMQALVAANSAPPGMAIFSLAQAELLEKAGVIAPGSEAYVKMMEIVNGAPRTDTGNANSIPTSDVGDGSWDVFNTGGGPMPYQWREGGRGGGGGGLQNYSGYVSSGYGPSLGLTNWRGI